MRQLARRLQRLESPAHSLISTGASTGSCTRRRLRWTCPQLCHQQLQADVDARLHALRQTVPASLTHERQVEAMVRQVCQAVRAVVDTVVDEPPRFGLDAALSEGCRRGGPPQRSPGMTRLHQRLQRLEAQAWEVEGRRLAQMTEAALDAEIVRVEAHYGVKYPGL